jgi:hypothetical protein
MNITLRLSEVGTVTYSGTPITVFGTVCPADTSVGIMASYVDIEDLQIGGVSVYELIRNSDIWESLDEQINEELTE